MFRIGPKVMMRLNSETIRLRPWLQAAIVVYLLAAVLVATMHQHHGALHGNDCALCAAAHTPALIAPAPVHHTAPAATGYLPLIPGEQRWDSEPGSTTRSRAPPLV